ncbi:hypothetical protein L0665_07310 [Methanogenium marinum]|uniref:Zinc-ribbon domain-containing protein n=1 Tax=Methanogenium marinum TaxID=348610 RepID=A0A9Q4KTG8_9EURY|nr:zinc ribbon domain-containing protein [Methanogenium marinum]MDE4908419.1 hypothetical protein [Methanogenium marinum]
MGIKQNVCPRCGEPVPEGGTICMICGQSLKKPRTIKKEHYAAVIFAVIAIILAYILYPVFFGPTMATSTGNVMFEVSLSDGDLSVQYSGTADGSYVADLQIAVLAEGGRSSQIFSFANPEPGTILGPVETGVVGKPVGIYYVAVYVDGTEISNTIVI